MTKITKWSMAGTFVILCVAATVFIFLRATGGQQAELLALLPPESDLYGTIEVKTLAGNTAIQKLLSNSPGLPTDQDYEKFVEATGFRYERDLERVAIARFGPDWIGAARIKLNRTAITQYLDSIGAVKSDVLGKTVYSYGLVRPFRLAFLDERDSGALVAFSAGGDSSRIRQSIERRTGVLKDSAASEYFQGRDRNRIPKTSQLWFIGKAETFLGAEGGKAQLGSFNLGGGFLRGSSRVFLSLAGSPSGAILQLEDECNNTADAERIAQTLGGILGMLKMMPQDKSSTPASVNKSSEPDPVELLSALSIEHTGQSDFLKWPLNEQRLQLLTKLLR